MRASFAATTCHHIFRARSRAIQQSLLTGLALSALLVSPASSAERTVAVPDFSGFWARNAFDLEPMPSGAAPVTNLKRLRDGTTDGTQLVGDYNNPILKPEAANLLKKRGEISISGNAFPDPSNHCAPYHPPYAFSIQLGMHVLQEKDQVTILYNQDDQVRRVRLNSTHPAKVVPSAMGDSIGSYESDTLVVDTVGIKAGPLVMTDRMGTPQSEAMHLIERYRLIGAAEAKEAQDRHEKQNGRIGGAAGAMPIDPTYGKGLQLQITVEDTNVFTTPWSAVITYRRGKDPWIEQVCAENFREYYANRDTEIPQADKPDF